MAKWVAHKSGQGEKWKVESAEEDTWYIKRETFNLWLPQSEYVEVPAPEVWVDVTEECEAKTFHAYSDGLYHKGRAIDPINYRLRKVQLWTVQPSTNILGEARWAFIVEKKQS